MPTPFGRWAVGAAVGLLAAGVGLVAAPSRHVVDGWSMAAGLVPGDVVASGWFPAADRWRRPARWDRRILVTHEGLPIVKRIVGLPGEAIAITAGDIVVDGRVVLKPPPVLGQVGVAVDAMPVRSAAWALPARVVWDDMTIGPPLSRRLEPTRDVGLAAEVLVPVGAGGDTRVRLRVADRIFGWRIATGGRFAVVGGRLDGHAVAVAWRLDAVADGDDRSAFSAGMPADWDVALPWTATLPADVAPPLALAVAPVADGRGLIERVTVWRDVHYRPRVPAADSWLLGADAWFVLGDYPDASIDSRRFGPVGRRALRQRVGSVRRASADPRQHAVGLVEHGHALGMMKQPLERLRTGRAAEAEFLDFGLADVGQEHEPPLAERPGEEPRFDRIGDECRIAARHGLVDEPAQGRALPPP